MLSIGKLGKGQERYYLEKVAEGTEDYYSGEGEEAGQWLGDAARELGLSGEVEPDQLVAMLTGMNPATGRAAWPARRPRPWPGPRLRSHLLRSQVGLPDLGAWRRGGRRPRSRPPTSAPSKSPSHYMQREACRTRRGRRRRRQGVRQGQRLPRRRLRPSLLAKRRSAAAYACADRQRDQGTGRQVDPPLPPGDLRPRQDRRLHLRGPPAPRADPDASASSGSRFATASRRSRASRTSG